MLEAAITTTSLLVRNPSISTRSWLSVWSRSPLMSMPRCPPTASSSSMNTIAGACLRATRNSRRIRAAPGRLRVEGRAGFVRDRLGEQRLAGSGWAVEQDPFRDLRAELAEAPRVADVVDDLAQLFLGLVRAGDVAPPDRRRRLGLDLDRLRLRHMAHELEHRDDEQPHEQDRNPVEHERLDVRLPEEVCKRHRARVEISARP